MKTTIQSQRSEETTLRRRWDLPGALSVTMTSANMKCLLKLCSRAEVLETSGTHIKIQPHCHPRKCCLDTTKAQFFFIFTRFPSGNQGSSSGSGGPSPHRDEGNDDLYQWQKQPHYVFFYNCCSWLPWRNKNSRTKEGYKAKVLMETCCNIILSLKIQQTI